WRYAATSPWPSASSISRSTARTCSSVRDDRTSGTVTVSPVRGEAVAGPCPEGTPSEQLVRRRAVTTVTPVLTIVPRVLPDPRSLSVLLRPRNDDPQLPDSTQRSIGPTVQDERQRAGDPRAWHGRAHVGTLRRRGRDPAWTA